MSFFGIIIFIKLFGEIGCDFFYYNKGEVELIDVGVVVMKVDFIF